MTGRILGIRILDILVEVFSDCFSIFTLGKAKTRIIVSLSLIIIEHPGSSNRESFVTALKVTPPVTTIVDINGTLADFQIARLLL